MAKIRVLVKPNNRVLRSLFGYNRFTSDLLNNPPASIFFCEPRSTLKSCGDGIILRKQFSVRRESWPKLYLCLLNTWICNYLNFNWLQILHCLLASTVKRTSLLHYFVSLLYLIFDCSGVSDHLALLGFSMVTAVHDLSGFFWPTSVYTRTDSLEIIIIRSPQNYVSFIKVQRSDLHSVHSAVRHLSTKCFSSAS